MGGKSEVSEQKLRATQDQLRLARLTQDLNISDDDRANIQKLVKKVVETTRCTISQAEIALYDNNNDVEEAVNAILEDNYPDENVWMEQKSRKAKRALAEEKADEFVSSNSKNRSNNPRNLSNSGYGRGRGTERGRGARGGARGTFSGRGSHLQTFAPTVGLSIASNVWDNSQANIDPNKEWANSTNTVIDDIQEEADWTSAGTLVFSRRDEPVAPSAPTISNPPGNSSLSSSSVPRPISFAAVAAAGNKKEKASTVNSRHSSSASRSTPSVTLPHPPSTTVPQSHNVIVSSSSQEDLCPSETGKSREVISQMQQSSNHSSNVTSTSKPASNVILQTATQPLSSAAPSMANNSSNWTAQLKSDLGIGEKSSIQQRMMPKSPLHNPKTVSRITRTTPRHSSTHPSSTVEFVSGEANGPSLPEYQFGFSVDSTTASEERGEEAYASAAKSRINNHSTKNEINPDSSSAIISSGSAINDHTTSLNQQHVSKISNASGNVILATPSQAMHGANTMQRHPVTSGLSYADTSSMSYPSSDARSMANSKVPLSLHHQQQTPHPLYTTTQPIYPSYPYMNMYSPVPGVRQEDYAAAATLVQYPFGMGQFDINSLSTMIPPAAALASQQPQNQPPPVQNQHQQRPDQHPNYVDLTKAYAAAAAAAVNSSAANGTATGLLGSQQQRDTSAVNTSGVAPPPGFSGPPSNMPTAAFTLPQHSHLNSIFQIPPTYHHPQLPFSFMLPSVTGNGQHKLSHQMFAQQTVDDSLPDQRLSSQQQKVYSAHQQMDKYGNAGGAKDRLGGGAQATPPPQVYQSQGYMSQQMPLHGQHKKAYGPTGPQHWSAT